MTDRIEKITQKIYNEGVIKAKDESNQIIAEAKAKAEEIIKSAKKEHEQLIQEAQRKAAEMKKKTEAEIQLAARQFTSTLKQKITNLISKSQVDGPIKEAFSEVKFIQKMILTILENWRPDQANVPDLSVILPEKTKKEMASLMDEKANKTMNKGVELNFDSKLKAGFKIGPKDGSYIISFTDEDFENYFKTYFKDRTKKLLFGTVDIE